MRGRSDAYPQAFPRTSILLRAALCLVVLAALWAPLATLRAHHGAAAEKGALFPPQAILTASPDPPATTTATPAAHPRRGAALLRKILLRAPRDPEGVRRGGAMGRLEGIALPYTYPVHLNIHPAEQLLAGVRGQASRDYASCAAHTTPPMQPTPLGWQRATPAHVNLAGLTSSFYAKGADGSGGDVTSSLEEGAFFDEHALSSAGQADLLFGGGGASRVWWLPESGNLPCSDEAQAGMFKSQNPESCGGALFLSTKLKENAHGLGSALSLVVHDLLSAIATGRVLSVAETKSRWFFAPPECGRFTGWTCYFSAPSRCSPPPGSGVSQLKRGSTARVAFKKNVDQKGFSRNDLPKLSSVLPQGCIAKVERWAADPQNAYVMGTFHRGADPLLTWWMAQALRYLLRAPQPWFYDAVMQNIRMMGFPFKRGAVFQQLRGEIAKFREYYNVFGCHDVALPAYVEWAEVLKSSSESSGGASMHVYISGNTPHTSYTDLQEGHRKANVTEISSTWNHPAALVGKESSRWGASSLVISWADFWTGVTASGWVCIVQSNWCRMINLLRLTAGRAECPFVDLGMTMLADPALRSQHCVVKQEWPTKPFSSVITKHSPVPPSP